MDQKEKTPRSHRAGQKPCRKGMAGGVYGGGRDADRKQERGALADAEEDRTNGVIGQARFEIDQYPKRLLFQITIFA